MNIEKNYHPDSNLLYRIWDHASFGLKKEIGNRENAPPNLIEKVGDATLWTVGLIPRSINAISKTFKDPRIATIVFTALGLFVTSLLFYPVTTFALTRVALMTTSNLMAQIPFWAVKLSTYMTICATIIGAGLRAEGRFTNADLMKEFYRLPGDFPYNPSRFNPKEIMVQRQAIMANPS